MQLYEEPLFFFFFFFVFVFFLFHSLLFAQKLHIRGDVHVIYFLFLDENTWGIHLKCLNEALQMNIHSICFRREIRKNANTFRLKKKTPYLDLCFTSFI